ncbi:MAG: sulfite exporter TauE/SafE family protein, partial [Lawsonibacter sp.]|nr:sulfite exporter TauE/SafE family protein [Lawsonibacter sp.]
VMGAYDAATIGVLSSITVFSMSVVSIGKQMLARTRIPFATAIPLAIGSVAGGQLGQMMLSALTAGLPNPRVTAVQNVALGLLILVVYWYMKHKQSIPGKHWDSLLPALLVGVFLGVCSSFLGIGGGPINVALIILLFSYDTKTATVCSLVAILFAQLSKLGSVALTTGFAAFDLRMAPVMIAGAVAGGFLGAGLNRRCRVETVEKAFNAVQLLVLGIAAVNIIRNLAC